MIRISSIMPHDIWNKILFTFIDIILDIFRSISGDLTNEYEYVN